MHTRKIIHIDMDAFYASVELREQPHLRGLPVVVAWDSPRSVICAASYEARAFGLRSAMSAARAKQLCPQAVFVPPHFDLYRQVSRQIHQIFHQYTDLVEPLALDEAYLDISHNKLSVPYATDVASQIRAQIFQQTGLTASAGIAPNKFLAKVASDWRKPNGQFVLPPPKIATFLHGLPIEKIPGVGQKTAQKLHRFGWKTAGDVQAASRMQLVHLLGQWGYRFYDLVRGVDNRPVQPSRERVQISTEITVPDDLPREEIALHLPDLAHDISLQMQRKRTRGQTVTLKLKTSDFHIYTRSQTYSSPLPDAESLLKAACTLLQKMPGEPEYRLIGIGISHLQPDRQQPDLWHTESTE